MRTISNTILKKTVILFLFIGIISSYIFVFKYFWPEYEADFIELGLLDVNNKIDLFFPNNVSKIYLGTPLKWNIFIDNHMQSDKEILLKNKLLYSSEIVANDKTNTPSLIESIYEFKFIIKKNEIKTIEFFWSVYDAVSIDRLEHYLVNDQLSAYDKYIIEEIYINGTEINSLSINNEIITTNAFDFSTSTYKILIETWVYDEELNAYVFRWRSKNLLLSSSIYMNFKLQI